MRRALRTCLTTISKENSWSTSARPTVRQLLHPVSSHYPTGAIRKGRQRLGDEPTNDEVKIDANHPELLRIQVVYLS